MWHILIVLAYAIVVYAAHRQWRDERFHALYLSTTREHPVDVSVLFADLVGFTTFAERADPADLTDMLSTFYAMATPLVAQRFGGEVEKFAGDAIMATFNRRGDQPDHAVRAARAGLELQRQVGSVAATHPGWPRLRVGVNTGSRAGDGRARLPRVRGRGRHHQRRRPAPEQRRLWAACSSGPRPTGGYLRTPPRRNGRSSASRARTSPLTRTCCTRFRPEASAASERTASS